MATGRSEWVEKLDIECCSLVDMDGMVPVEGTVISVTES